MKHNTNHTSFSILKGIYTKALLLLLCLSLSAKVYAQAKNDLNESDVNQIHVAFAGGGWLAHTGHSAWIMSLLAANHLNLDNLNSPHGNSKALEYALSNVQTISANSGGSWFSSMLMFDENFVKEITMPDAATIWGETTGSNQGWLGKQHGYFENYLEGCRRANRDSTLFQCILLDHFSHSLMLAPNWYDMVENLVFRGYNANMGTLGTATRQKWASDKTYLMASTLLTNSVVLNKHDLFDGKLYYQVCEAPYKIVADSAVGAHCVNEANQKVSMPNVLPVTFTSLPKNTTQKALPFFATQNQGFNLGYTGEYLIPADSKMTSLSGNYDTGNIDILAGTAASSAAVGYAASYDIAHNMLPWPCDILDWDCIYHARDLSVGFGITTEGPNENSVNFLPCDDLDGLNLKKLADQKVLRLADGGAVDNSGIAQLIAHLQWNSKNTIPDYFNIVAFDEIASNDAIDPTLYPSSDISNLFFGASCNQICLQGNDCMTVPELSIMKLDTTVENAATKHTWYVRDENGKPTADSLHYYTYQVVTVDNPVFKIKAGNKGMIKVFASEFAGAVIAPSSMASFNTYQRMVSSFYPTLKNKPDVGTTFSSGLQLLQEAFGLVPEEKED